MVKKGKIDPGYHYMCDTFLCVFYSLVASFLSFMPIPAIVRKECVFCGRYEAGHCVQAADNGSEKGREHNSWWCQFKVLMD